MAKKNKQPEQWKYTGFSKPESNFFKMPNDWPNITAKISSLAELKVVEYVLRHTWGYQEYDIAKRITTNEFMKGRKDHNGDRIDSGTGLSNRSVIDGLRRAVDHGFLIEDVDDRDKARVKKYYKLNMKSPDGIKKSGVKNLHTGMKNLHSNYEQSSHRSEKETTEINKYVVVKRLREFKISEEKANELAYRYSDEYIGEKVEFLEWKLAVSIVGRPIKDSAAWLIKAIENDYKPPEGFKSLSDLEKEKEEERLRQEELEIGIQAEKKREREQRDRIIATYQIPNNLVGIWKKILEGLKAEGSYQALLPRLENSFLLSIEGNTATVLVDGSENKKWLENRAKSILETRFVGALGKQVKVRFEVIEI